MGAEPFRSRSCGASSDRGKIEKINASRWIGGKDVRRGLFAGCLLMFVCAVLTSAQAPAGGDLGPTVWDGIFTEDQAARGRGQFFTHCSECHGDALEGGEGKPLSGESFQTDFRQTTVDYLLRQISRNMPYSMDGSLQGTLPIATYVDILSHILNSNGYPAGSAELTPASSVGVQIVAKDGPGALPDNVLAQVVGCLERDADRQWRLVNATQPKRVLADGPPFDVDAPLGDAEFDLMFVLTSLDKYAGFRMTATGRLIGEGGADGINVSTVNPVSETCQ